MKSRTLWPERRTTQAPASTPKRIPPQTPSPPCQTASGPHHCLGHLAPARDVVVEARADDPGTDAPDRDAEDEIPVAAAPHPAVAGQRQAGRDRQQQHQPVHVDRERAEVDRAARRRRNEREEAHRHKILPVAAVPCLLEQDFQRQLGCAAGAKQIDRVMQVDVLPLRELGRRPERRSPAISSCSARQASTSLDLFAESRFLPQSSPCLFGRSGGSVLPLPGDLPRPSFSIWPLSRSPSRRKVRSPSVQSRTFPARRDGPAGTLPCPLSQIRTCLPPSIQRPMEPIAAGSTRVPVLASFFVSRAWSPLDLREEDRACRGSRGASRSVRAARRSAAASGR